MSAGPAQLELIRRYHRTLRAMSAEAVRARGPRIGARERRSRAAQEAQGRFTRGAREGSRTSSAA
jgi:hypothetical protein